MDLLTKYRPVRSLEFYQIKVIRFLYSSEGSDDIRTLGIPFGELGFDTPLHFIRCIPEGLCENFMTDALFRKMDKTLRKGNRVFLVSEDGKIQSTTFKGFSSQNDKEAVLDGHRQTYPIENVIPYKAFLRRNVGAMLVEGSHKIVGTNVVYEESTWDVGSAIYYKPLKRWGVIENRDLIRGKICCDVRLERVKLKKEKVLRISMAELTKDAVPYRKPLIPKNNANVSKVVKHEQTETVDRRENPSNNNNINEERIKEEKAKLSLRTISSSVSQDDDNRNQLNREESKEDSDKIISLLPSPEKETAGESESSSGESNHGERHQAPINQVENQTTIIPPTSEIKSQTPENETIDGPSEKIPLRRNPSKTMRPLTEYFHSLSVEIADDQKTIGPDLKFKSVNNLNAQASEEDDPTFEDYYSNSLRRSARKVLSKRLAEEASHRRSLQDRDRRRKQKASLSTDNLVLLQERESLGVARNSTYVTVSDTDNNRFGQTQSSDDNRRPIVSISNSANDTSDTEEFPPPPPLPKSTPPPFQYDSGFRSFEDFSSASETLPTRNYENYGDPVAVTANTRNFTWSTSSEPAAHFYHQNQAMDYYYPPSNPQFEAPQQPQSQQYRSTTGSVSSNYYHYDNPYDFTTPYLEHAESVFHLETTDQAQIFRGQIELPKQELKAEKSKMEMKPRQASTSSTMERQPQKPEMKYRQASTSSTMERQPQKLDMRHRQASTSSTMERQRYKKNPALKTKIRSSPTIASPAKEHQEVVEPPLPNPFTIENIKSAVGKGRGIQSGFCSNYADISLFSLFFCSKIFDNILLDCEDDKGMKMQVKKILKERVITPLRLTGFCGWESICHLREAMLSLSSKLNSSFMDAEEFLYLLFENALGTPEFIKYSNGTKDFMHQIIIKPKDRSRCQDVQFLLETSLEVNSLKFMEIKPALFLCMPRCNGRLVYYEAIIPTVKLNITSLIDKGPKKCLCEMAATLECALCQKSYGEGSLGYCPTCQRMADQIHFHIGHSPILVPKAQENVNLSLLAVICMKNNYYSAFVKTGVDKFSPWLYYEATPNETPQVILLEDFGRWLDKLEREPGRYREFAKTHVFLKRIITESHICIYFSPEKERSGYAESFMV